jgi:cell volume regulation protein A
MLASQDELPKLDETFRSDHVAPKREAAQARFFGEFLIDSKAPATALADAYGLELPESAKTRNVAEFFKNVIPQPVVGDRLRLGEMELVVKRMDGEKITEIGLRLPH